MNKRSNWLVVYDIRDASRLRKIAKLLESFGIRVQKSIFELSCSENDINNLKFHAKSILKDEDYMIFFSICEKDWQKKEIYGKLCLGKNIMNKTFVVL